MHPMVSVGGRKYQKSCWAKTIENNECTNKQTEYQTTAKKKKTVLKTSILRTIPYALPTQRDNDIQRKRQEKKNNTKSKSGEIN